MKLTVKQKISRTMKGKMPSFVPDNTGKVRTPEMRKKYSETFRQDFQEGRRKSWNKGKSGLPSAKKGKKYPHLCGELSKKWKGGTWKYWRLKTLERDLYTCQTCGLEDKEIVEVDHIKPKREYPELKFDMTNLITLCPNCHVRKTKRNKDLTRKSK